MFAHRYSTRAVAAGAACQVELSEAEFALRKRLGLFAMDWESAGHCFGVGMELNYWLATGLSVVVNGSHAILEHALKGYPEMTLIWITAALRDHAPQLEPAPRIVGRPVGPPARATGYRMVHLSSNGSLEIAGEKLIEVLTGQDQ